MIVDCFTFFNEFELLEIRLEELKDVVDYFVLVEAGETFSGKPKKCLFEANQKAFESYPMRYIKIERFPDNLTSAWQREDFSRDALSEGLSGLDPAPTDVVLLSDVDEIPRADVVSRYARRIAGEAGTCYLFSQVLHYYYLNCRSAQPWNGTRMARYEDISSLQELRRSGGSMVPDAGWHFSYLGGPERIRQKIGAYSHTDLCTPQYTDPAHLERCLAEAKDIFGRDMGLHIVPLDATYPRYLMENRPRFEPLIARNEY